MARPPWTAEHAVDAAQARALVTHLPALAGHAPALVGEGWDNVAFRFGEWLVRFPRRAVAAEIIEHEIAALPWLAQRLPLPVPVPELVGGPAPGFPARFAAYRMLPGETADRVAPPETAKPSLAEALAGFLGALHAVPVDEARAHGVPPDTFRAPIERQLAVAAEHLARVETAPQIAAHAAPLRSLLDALRPAALQAASVPFAPHVLHGDLHTRHLLLEPRSHTLCGVIDWGDVCIGDPAIDLRIAWLWLPPTARARLRERLPAHDDATWLRARIHAVKAVASLLAWGQSTGDEVAVREAIASIPRVLDAG